MTGPDSKASHPFVLYDFYLDNNGTHRKKKKEGNETPLLAKTQMKQVSLLSHHPRCVPRWNAGALMMRSRVVVPVRVANAARLEQRLVLSGNGSFFSFFHVVQVFLGFGVPLWVACEWSW
jgi:hypothetical protein